MPLRASVRAVGRFSVARARLDRGSCEAGSLGAVVASGEARKGRRAGGRKVARREDMLATNAGRFGREEPLRDRARRVSVWRFSQCKADLLGRRKVVLTDRRVL